MVHVIKNNPGLTLLPALEINSKLTPFDLLERHLRWWLLDEPRNVPNVPVQARPQASPATGC